ncbi:hypothetical protein ACOSQ2_018174 [Xanthoceras sorbifolium]
MSLSEKDSPIAMLDSNLQHIRAHKLSLCLVGKVITNKVINREAFRSILPKIWKTAQDIDIEPLKRCVRMVLDSSGKAVTMLLRYDRLSKFCFHCSLLGHATRECVDIDHNKLADEHSFDYGGWLRVSSPVRSRQGAPHLSQSGSDLGGPSIVSNPTLDPGLKQRPRVSSPVVINASPVPNSGIHEEGMDVPCVGGPPIAPPVPVFPGVHVSSSKLNSTLDSGIHEEGMGGSTIGCCSRLLFFWNYGSLVAVSLECPCSF